MKLTNEDLDILISLLELKLNYVDTKTKIVNPDERPEIYINIIRKLETMYFL